MRCSWCGCRQFKIKNAKRKMSPSLVVRVRFKSQLSLEGVMKVAEERIDQFRALKGLVQKYYLEDPATGEVAGLYFWDSKESLDEFNSSELRATIAKAYQVVGEPTVEVYRVMMPLR